MTSGPQILEEQCTCDVVYSLTKRDVMQQPIHSSNGLLCASMCTSNVNCEAYFYEAAQCHETGASSLVGSPSKLPTTKDVYIDQSLYINNKGKYT